MKALLSLSLALLIAVSTPMYGDAATTAPKGAPTTPPATSTPAAPAQSAHQFDTNDPNVQKYPIYATANTAAELVPGSSGWRSATEIIAEQKRDDPDYLIDGKTFYEWRMAPIQAWVDKYLADNGLSIKGKTDYEKTEIIKKIIDDGRLEEFIGLWLPGFKHNAEDCVPRADALKFLMIAMDFEFFDIVSGLWGSTPHAWNAYWDSGVNAVRFLDANPNAGVWNLYVDELDEQTHTLD